MLAGAAFIDITGIEFLTGAFGIFFAGSIFSVTVFADAIIRDFTGDIITRTGGNTFFEIRAVIRTGVGRFLTFGTGGLGISFLAAALGIVEVIVITSGRYAAVILIGIIPRKLIAGTVGCVGHETGGCEFYFFTLFFPP